MHLLKKISALIILFLVFLDSDLVPLGFQFLSITVLVLTVTKLSMKDACREFL